MKYLQQTISGVAGNGRAPRSSIFAAPRTSAWAPRSSTFRGAAGIGLGTAINYLRRTTSGSAGDGLGTTSKYLRRTASVVAGNGLGW
jgi:hypothetical protein